MRLPARVRTGLKRGHGLLEDWVVVLGSLEVNDVLRGIDVVDALVTAKLQGLAINKTYIHASRL